MLLDLPVLLLLPLTPPAVATLHKRDTETPEQVFGDQVTQCLGLHAAPEGPPGLLRSSCFQQTDCQHRDSDSTV